MKLKTILQEAEKIGHKRLVSSIVSIINKRKGKTPSRGSVASALRKIDKDKAFLDRIRRKANKLGSEGYYWNAIRRRAAAYL